MAEANSVRRAVGDLSEGAARWRLWTTLSWSEMRRMYQRSSLGLLWSTVNIAFFVIVLGSLYTILWNRPAAAFIPHLMLGVLVWNFLNNTVTAGCYAFIRGERYLLEVRLPLSVFIFQALYTNAIVFAFQLPLYVAIVLYYSIPVSPEMALALIGLVGVAANGLWMALIAAMINVRYRDFSNVLGNIMRIGFLLTPIIWMPDMVGTRAELVGFNPFFHMIETVRAPLQGNLPSTANWAVTFALPFVGLPIAIIVLARVRRFVPYWV